ncbi:facilitated trehalose transporter Tret1-like [Diorhabda sublineata]|uniref:facilitated trehalose transporter Tret1-like n=1 Tax=Diorhabda sublineata TaxID=1163346 RepID=UPI0024E13D7D|nr:facilitated trehalose transporter Tret1-like [Diorhabda sublineata]XP_056632047.1 facilitated trehalose transporter Tret1-like [Diorhabda sublineata]XP_056632048.1 facilitated trehalose transporter Tret1-like [Diorhabda sublineata]
MTQSIDVKSIPVEKIIPSKKDRVNFSYYVAASVNMMTILAGIGYAWSSPCISKLTDKVGSEFNPLPKPATLSEITWITSLHCLGAISGPLFTGIIANKLGKKKTIILFALPQIISNIILIFANNVTHFYVARFLLGIGTGCVFSLIPVYVAEMSHPKYRGRTSMFLSLTITCTQDFVFIVGPYVTIRTLAIISLVPSVIFFPTFSLLMPESPYDYVRQDNISKAHQALIKVAQHSNVDDELNSIIKSVSSKNGKFKLSDALFSRSVQKSFLIGFGLMFFQQFNGTNALNSYQQSILSATKSSIPADKSVMIVGAAQLLVLFFVSKLVDGWGRKKLLLVSYIGQFISLVSFGIYFHLQNLNMDISFLFWLPLTSILLFMFSFKIGAGPVSWIIVGEIFPTEYKFFLSPLIAFCMTFMSFLVTFIFPKFSHIFGFEYSFWFFSVVVACAIPFVFFIVPETKGQTLEEIQKNF